MIVHAPNKHETLTACGSLAPRPFNPESRLAGPGEIITCIHCRDAIKWTVNSFKRYRYRPEKKA